MDHQGNISCKIFCKVNVISISTSLQTVIIIYDHYVKDDNLIQQTTDIIFNCSFVNYC